MSTAAADAAPWRPAEAGRIVRFSAGTPAVMPHGAPTIRWYCHELFQRMPPGATAGGIAVVIDVLRASTTMITALANGATRVIPAAAVDEARRLAEAIDPPPLLGGERGGVRIAGFDLGNSPLDYTPDRVGGRAVVITTTNGTAALHASLDAAEIMIGAIVNRAAVAETARRLAVSSGKVHLVCAGTDGAVSAEDVLAAGAILDAARRQRLARAEGGRSGGDDEQSDPAARSALAAFEAVASDRGIAAADSLAEAFRTCRGGENLIALGMEADLMLAARIDAFDVVPRLRRPAWDLAPAGA